MLTFGKLFLINIAVLFSYMFIIYFSCPDYFSGSTCVKAWGNKMFLLQIILNIGVAIYYLTQVDKSRWFTFIINIILLISLYTVIAVLASICKSGLF